MAQSLKKKRLLGLVTNTGGGGAARWASRAAPAGYRWDFVTRNGVMVTRAGEPVVSLVRTS